MSLLREIQTEATSESASTANLLRKAQVLAARLDYEPLAEWVKHELDGYYGDGAPDLPDYRRLGKVQVLGHFQGAFGAEMRNAPIAEYSIDENLRDSLFSHDFRGSVAELEASLAGDAASEHPGALTVDWPTPRAGQAKWGCDRDHYRVAGRGQEREGVSDSRIPRPQRGPQSRRAVGVARSPERNLNGQRRQSQT